MWVVGWIFLICWSNGNIIQGSLEACCRDGAGLGDIRNGVPQADSAWEERVEMTVKRRRWKVIAQRESRAVTMSE